MRRRSCHVLLLNYFINIGGLEALCRRFEQAAANVWTVLEQQQQQQQKEKDTFQSPGATKQVRLLRVLAPVCGVTLHDGLTIQHCIRCCAWTQGK